MTSRGFPWLHPARQVYKSAKSHLLNPILTPPSAFSNSTATLKMLHFLAIFEFLVACVGKSTDTTRVFAKLIGFSPRSRPRSWS